MESWRYSTPEPAYWRSTLPRIWSCWSSTTPSIPGPTPSLRAGMPPADCRRRGSWASTIPSWTRSASPFPTSRPWPPMPSGGMSPTPTSITCACPPGTSAPPRAVPPVLPSSTWTGGCAVNCSAVRPAATTTASTSTATSTVAGPAAAARPPAYRTGWIPPGGTVAYSTAANRRPLPPSLPPRPAS